MNWSDRVIPLPQRLQVHGSARMRAGEVGLYSEGFEACPFRQPALKTAVGLLRAFALAEPADERFLIRLRLADPSDPVCPHITGPRAAQAYTIRPLGEGKGLELAANAPVGLLYAARTLAQLVRAPKVGPESALELPLVEIEDWPDVEERGEWGGGSEGDMAWTAQWKLNTLEAMSGAGVDAQGRPELRMSRDLFRQGAELGVKVVPIILHLELIAEFAGLMKRSDVTSTPDPSKPLPSDYVPGLCMSSPATHELVAGWLEAAAEIEGVTDVMVWLSEETSPCFCERCIGQEPYGLEVACIVAAYRRVQERHPELGLRLLTTQGSYKVNDKVLAATPPDVGVSYYDGRRTYDSSRQPMIYPLMEEFARSGRWLGVYPQITHVFRTVLPWTAPQFMQFRGVEFADKGLRNVIGYAVPSNRHHEFNVMALAEWTWNAHGRSPEDFARAYAVSQGLSDPELYARWALLAGQAGWLLAESRVTIRGIYDGGLSTGGAAKFAKLFEGFGLLEPAVLAEALTQARQALELARQLDAAAAAAADAVAESEVTLAGLEGFQALQQLATLLEAGDAAALPWLEQLDRCAVTWRRSIVAWGERVAARSGEKVASRLLDTAYLFLRQADGARARAAELGWADPRPESRLVKIGEWKGDDFRHSPQAVLHFDLAGLVAPEGGAYQACFDFAASAWGVDVAAVRVLAVGGAGERANVLAESPDITAHIGRYDRWYEKRIQAPAAPAGARLVLEVALTGTPVDAPAERRSCEGAIGLRRVTDHTTGDR
ncbi:MAG: hypothetical protein GXY76_10575 [Chloroflexi bacterium]|nr:hypothetical protein [Chloroflexota bacterium]